MPLLVHHKTPKEYFPASLDLIEIRITVNLIWQNFVAEKLNALYRVLNFLPRFESISNSYSTSTWIVALKHNSKKIPTKIDLMLPNKRNSTKKEFYL